MDPRHSATAAPPPPPDDQRRRRVDEALRRHRGRPDALIEILHVAQQAYGCLDRQILADLAERLNLPESEVFGVATFYHAFTLRPQGEHTCTVCTGTVCHAQGAGAIMAALEEAYAVQPGETTADGRLTLAAARCVGICSLAPLLVVDGTILGHEHAEGIAARVEAHLGGAAPGREEPP